MKSVSGPSAEKENAVDNFCTSLRIAQKMEHSDFYDLFIKARFIQNTIEARIRDFEILLEI